MEIIILRVSTHFIIIQLPPVEGITGGECWQQHHLDVDGLHSAFLCRDVVLMVA